MHASVISPTKPFIVVAGDSPSLAGALHIEDSEGVRSRDELAATWSRAAGAGVGAWGSSGLSVSLWPAHCTSPGIL